MKVVYANEKAPISWNRSIFLAGPTPRAPKSVWQRLKAFFARDSVSWRSEALKLLKEAGYDGVVFVPEDREGEWSHDYTNQLEWEEKHLHLADCIIFWIPRDLKKLPGFTTNDEWGAWKYSGKTVFGAPLGAPKTKYQRYYAKKLNIPSARTLEETIGAALEFVGEGAYRIGGECEVPLYIWNTQSFKDWYRALKKAGHRLAGARVEWMFRVGPSKDVVGLWALHVNVFIPKEGRNKSSEVVIGRPDVAHVLLYRAGDKIENADIVLVREFRSPVSNRNGYIWELPGGSSVAETDIRIVAANECKEETGFEINPERLRYHGARQLAPTLSAHKAHIFSAYLTRSELEYFINQKGAVHGCGDSERTFVEVVRFRDLFEGDNVDWTTLGMITSVLRREEA